MCTQRLNEDRFLPVHLSPLSLWTDHLRRQDQNDFITNYAPFQEKIDLFNRVFSHIANGTQEVNKAIYVMGGITLWSARSSSFLAAVNGCAMLALILLSNTMIHYLEGVHKNSATILELTVANRGEFPSKIQETYDGMERGTVILRSYIGAVKRDLIDGEVRGLQMLRKEIKAIEGLEGYIATVQSYQKNPEMVAVSSEIDINIGEIKAFFQKLERVADQGKQLGAAGALLGMAYLYSAYMSRAYLMIIAGLGLTLMNGLLFSKACSYEMGMAEIKDAEEENLVAVFNRHANGFLMPKVADISALQQVVVIPLDRVLKLIPACYESEGILKSLGGTLHGAWSRIQ